MAQTPLLSVNDLYCERHDRILINNLSFEIHQGELSQVHGSNGSGKSTLLKTIVGLITPLKGHISWQGRALSSLDKAAHRNITYLGHKAAIKSELTVLENIKRSLSLRQQSFDLDEINQAVNDLSIQQYLNVDAGYLSQGQQRRIALCRLWLEKSQLWVLDEPYTALDKTAIELINQKIIAFLAQGNAVIMTSHQNTLAAEFVHQNIWLEQH